MANLEWTPLSPSIGISHGAVYAANSTVYAWPGITTIADTSLLEGPTQYLDGKVQTINKPDGEYSATIKAYTYPEVLDDEAQFLGLTYRTSSELHLVYNPVVLSTGTQGWDTDSDSQSLLDFEFSVSALASLDSSISHVVVDLEVANAAAISALEDFLYGTDLTGPGWPSIDWVIDQF